MCSQNFSLLQVIHQLLAILGSLAVEEARLTNGGRDSHKVIVTCNIVSKRDGTVQYYCVWNIIDSYAFYCAYACACMW